MAHSRPPSRCETWGCRVDRRNFLKTSGAVLSLPLLNGCVPRALIAASEPVVESVVKTCAGTWRGLPLGWARFTDFFNGSPPLNHCTPFPRATSGGPRGFPRAAEHRRTGEGQKGRLLHCPHQGPQPADLAGVHWEDRVRCHAGRGDLEDQVLGSATRARAYEPGTQNHPSNRRYGEGFPMSRISAMRLLWIVLVGVTLLLVLQVFVWEPEEWRPRPCAVVVEPHCTGPFPEPPPTGSSDLPVPSVTVTLRPGAADR
jgi:hypothetical protein